MSRANRATSGNTLLTIEEFYLISARLRCLSQTWYDLWHFLRLTRMETGRALRLTFLECEQFSLPYTAREIIDRRRRVYPDDIWLFQSHSNRVKFKNLPVTHIAFNRAIRIASTGMTKKRVSSKSARNIVSVTVKHRANDI
ncbi:hypothetical protein MUU47_22840 [Scandinavium sp. H11S7]|uniref:Uncharacterized protein n=1 Tax=Scandinavium hiltneri TaxID=2926519 RepID=A0ABT2E7V1_9ENTR|nr:hypothetical protein [Scandinavium hiltneri]MCS2163913.1 hypothetical protein [Scandinavium hiltneri]